MYLDFPVTFPHVAFLKSPILQVNGFILKVLFHLDSIQAFVRSSCCVFMFCPIEIPRNISLVPAFIHGIHWYTLLTIIFLGSAHNYSWNILPFMLIKGFLKNKYRFIRLVTLLSVPLLISFAYFWMKLDPILLGSSPLYFAFLNSFRKYKPRMLLLHQLLFICSNFADVGWQH